ncbi:hypothetical protein CFC21_079630, partial [Triticum aestivum]
RRTTRKRRRRR